MFLSFEDYVWNLGPNNEIINSKNICRIRVGRKRIRIWMNYSSWNYVFIGKTEHNLRELKKLGVE